MLIFLNIKEFTNFFFILLSIMMFFFCLYLYFNNQKLKQRISKLETETKEILERKLVKENPNDLVSIESISINPKDKKVTSHQYQSNSNKKNMKLPPKENSSQVKYAYKQTSANKSSKITQENSIKISNSNNNNKRAEFSSRNSISNKKVSENSTMNSISSKRTSEFSYSNYKTSKEKGYNIPLVQKKFEDNFLKFEQQGFNLNEFIQKEEKVVPNLKESNQEVNYLNEISNQIADELSPKTIELTDYEKRQEEQAVISYQELLALKDKFENKADDENSTFIEDLKQFRNKLN